MGECIFCKIIKGEIPSTKVYEDATVFAFDDIEPMAPVHTLIVPKKHIETLNDLSEIHIWDAMLKAAQEIARIKGVEDSGYRTVINCGKDGTQIVTHLHMHLLGGRLLDSRMG
ncbi:MAG: histidine triad nucleotide-binding protein [Thermodesulfobacteriota bacterium]|nr:histidine triad nucleotide-binding protein [Thermodesulfobacteriota bacterium]